jgi:hypothetical protein
MLPAIPSAINAGARGSAGGQASIIESDDFGDRSAQRGSCSSDLCHLCLFTCVLPIAPFFSHLHAPPLPNCTRHRFVFQGVLPSLLPVDSRVSSTSEKVTLPPKTPPGGYSLRFNKVSFSLLFRYPFASTRVLSISLIHLSNN